MSSGENREADRIFEDLEKSFESTQKKRKTLIILFALGIPVGLILILVGLSTSIFVSVVGYVMMLVCALKVYRTFKDFFLLNLSKYDHWFKFTKSRR